MIDAAEHGGGHGLMRQHPRAQRLVDFWHERFRDRRRGVPPRLEPTSLEQMRKGEMARLWEVPFGRYYGTVDGTPLFVLLAAAYYERTADIEFLREIWPGILAALEWIDVYGDLDRDGFVEYARQTDHGGGRKRQGGRRGLHRQARALEAGRTNDDARNSGSVRSEAE